jgi:hypothetical protein
MTTSMHLFEGLVQVKTKFGYFNHAFFELPENFIACFFCFDVRSFTVDDVREKETLCRFELWTGLQPALFER